MADGSFRHVIQDEEHRREEYLDRQLEVGWEDNPADRALEPRNRVTVDQLMEANEELMSVPRSWRKPPVSRRLSRAASAARHRAPAS
ncbi:MAG: hypothetical protein AB1609_23120 [Bacillota bacterium]